MCSSINTWTGCCNRRRPAKSTLFPYTTLWTSCAGPLDVSRNEIVITASESTARPTTTMRRRYGERERDVSGDEAGRRTDESSTANREVRLRVRVATG